MNNQPIVLQERFKGLMTVAKHGKRLEMALRNFIISMDGSYYDDELDNGIISSYFQIDNGICVEQKVRISQTDYVCYTNLSVHTTADDKERIVQYITIANNINLELDYGNFEVDTATGDIRFRTYYEPINIVGMEALDKLLGYPKRIISKYGHLFLSVI